MLQTKKPAKPSTPSPASIVTEVITTPYEKVITTLNAIRTYIKTIPSFPLEYLNDLNWVIEIISKHKLYKFEIVNQNDLLEKYKEAYPDMQHLIQYINNYYADFKPKPRMRHSNNALNNLNLKQFDLQTPSRNLQRGKHMTFCVNRNNIPNPNNTNTNIDNITDNNFQRDSKHFFTNITSNTNNNNTLKSDSNNNDSNDEGKNVIKHICELASKGIFTTDNESQSDDVSNEHLLLDEDEDSFRINNKDNNNISNNNSSVTHKFNEINIDNILSNVNYDTKQILSIDFDIFELKSIVSYNNVLPLIGTMIFDYFGFDKNIINTTKLNDFLSTISSSYHSSVLYHNAIHASDVTQTATLFIINSNIEDIANTNINDILSIIIACLGHDIGHPGYNNTYHMNAMTDIAITYNDVSILESYHSAQLFKIMRTSSCNIFDSFPDYDYKVLRKRIISQILATDMARHNKIVSIMKTKVEQLTGDEGVNMEGLLTKGGNAGTIFEEQEVLFDFMVHSADIAHNAKRFEISVQWVELLSYEFWKQGDKEKDEELPVSFLCDRNDVDVPKSQIGFIKGFILPIFDLIKAMFPTLNVFYDNAKNNLDVWTQLSKENRKTGFSPERKENKNENV